MRIPSEKTDRYIYFVAVDSTDLKTRETGLDTFTVYGSKNGAAAAAFTTPTVNETDGTNMAGVYELLVDEQTTLTAGNDTEELCLHITHAGMAPVTRIVEIYRPETTEGNTLTVESDGDLTKVNTLDGHTAQTGDNYTRLGVPTGASIAADIAENQTDLNTILADTNELQTDWTNGGRLDLIIDAVLADTNELQTDLTNGGRLDLILDATLADTNELQTDLTDGGRLDLILDAVLVDTGTTIPGTITTAQNDLDILTGADGVTLATLQPNYAPNTVVPDAAGTAPTAVQIREEIDSNSTQLMEILLDTGTTLPTAIAAIASTAGSGGTSETITITNGSGTPIDNVGVWITTDSAGSNVVAGTSYTNSSGQVTFMLDAGTYYCWREKGGITFTNPQTLTVS